MIAFIFPGQGSQYAGMGKDLVEQYSVARETFEEANDALGFDLAGLCFNGPEEDLKLTANTQPAILTHSIAALRAFEQECGVKAAIAAGHSLGEYSALVCSGALGFADAVQTVRKRGTFMQEAVPVGQGTMAAIMGLENEILDEVCIAAAEGEVVAPANFNSPGQVVIAGAAAAVARACELAKEKGAKRALPLPVSAPFHCAMMQPAADRLLQVLTGLTLQPMSLPVVSNVEAEANSDHTRITELLVRQVCAPVRWTESVAAMDRLGVSKYVEIGPGKVLSGLVKRIVKGAEAVNIEGVASLASFS